MPLSSSFGIRQLTLLDAPSDSIISSATTVPLRVAVSLSSPEPAPPFPVIKELLIQRFPFAKDGDEILWTKITQAIKTFIKVESESAVIRSLRLLDHYQEPLLDITARLQKIIT